MANSDSPFHRLWLLVEELQTRVEELEIRGGIRERPPPSVEPEPYVSPLRRPLENPAE